VDVRCYRILIKAFGWQMTFILEGVPSILWAFIWVLLVRDHPQETRWMSKDCCDHLQSELALEQTWLPSMANLRATLRVHGVLLLCFQSSAGARGSTDSCSGFLP